LPRQHRIDFEISEGGWYVPRFSFFMKWMKLVSESSQSKEMTKLKTTVTKTEVVQK
jgi:hypothetical protein